MDKKETITENGIPYINWYNLNIILKFLFLSGWRSAFVWLMVTIASFVLRGIGVVVVLFVALITIILKGIYKKMWLPHNPEERNR